MYEQQPASMGQPEPTAPQQAWTAPPVQSTLQGNPAQPGFVGNPAPAPSPYAQWQQQQPAQPPVQQPFQQWQQPAPQVQAPVVPVPPPAVAPVLQPQAQPQVVPPAPVAPVDGPDLQFTDPTSQALASSIQMLANDSKVDLMQAFGPAWEAKNPAFINMQYLQQVAPERAAVLAQQFTALVQYEDARVGQVVNQVHTMAGGAEQWQAAVTVFKQTAPAEVQAVLASMVDSGNPAQVQYAVQQILQTARQSGSVPFVQQPFLQGNQATGTGAMTKEAFAKAEQALSKQYPVGSPQYNSQYDALVQQRAQARALGY